MCEQYSEELQPNFHEQNEAIIPSFVEVEIMSEKGAGSVVETLTRMGMGNFKNKQLFQSCHLLKKFGRYYIVHFKELYALDNLPTNFTDEDKQRRNQIALLLEDWGLVKVLDLDKVDNKGITPYIRVISSRDANDWELTPKYVMRPIPQEADKDSYSE